MVNLADSELSGAQAVSVLVFFRRSTRLYSINPTFISAMTDELLLYPELGVCASSNLASYKRDMYESTGVQDIFILWLNNNRDWHFYRCDMKTTILCVTDSSQNISRQRTSIC